MNRFRSKWVLLAIFILLAYLIYVGMRAQPFAGKASCIKSFDEFAYWPDEASYPIEKVLPLSPWQVEATIPGQETAIDKSLSVLVESARTKNGEQEIWLDDGAVFLIYHPEGQIWKEVSSTIGDTNLVVNDLFLTSDGTIWGGISTLTPASLPDQLPVLSRFNEVTQQFEIAPGILEISIIKKKGHYIEAPKIVLDQQDIFWLFVPQDGIYRYDPKDQTATKQVDRPDMVSIDTTLSLDGSIYFREGNLYDDTEEFLFQFFPETGNIVTIEVPSNPWEYSGPMSVDQEGRLWLSAMGYREVDGRWHLLHPDPQAYLKHRSPAWALPTLIFESSNG